jgi:hypothetical protein
MKKPAAKKIQRKGRKSTFQPGAERRADRSAQAVYDHRNPEAAGAQEKNQIVQENAGKVDAIPAVLLPLHCD